MSTPYNINSLVVPPGTTAEDAATQAHLTLLSCLELAQQLTELISGDESAGRTAFALVYLLENAEKLASVADDELQRRALGKEVARAAASS